MSRIPGVEAMVGSIHNQSGSIQVASYYFNPSTNCSPFTISFNSIEKKTSTLSVTLMLNDASIVKTAKVMKRTVK
jgi:hypothetical protein